MNCKKCGSLLTENDQFCKNCGAAVNQVSASNNGMVNNTMQQPMNNNMGGQAVNQQPVNQQQAWANGYTQQPNYNQMQPQNVDNIKKFILIGISIAAVVFIGFILFFVFADDSDYSDSGVNNNGGIVDNGGTNNNNTNNNNNNNNSGVTQTSSTYKVKHKGFTFKIPNDLMYQIDGDTFYIGDEDETWITAFELGEGSFEQLQINKDQIQGLFQESGVTASPAQIKTLGGVKFITSELSVIGENTIGAYVKLNATNIAFIVAISQNNDFDYSILEKIAPIISTATYSGASNSIKPDNKINFSTISGLVK